MHIHATRARSARESLSGANKLAKDTRGQPLRVSVRRQIGARGLLRERSWKTRPSLKRKNEWRDFHAFAPFFRSAPAFSPLLPATGDMWPGSESPRRGPTQTH